MFHSVPGLYPLDAVASPLSHDYYISRHFQMSPGEWGKLTTGREFLLSTFTVISLMLLLALSATCVELAQLSALKTMHVEMDSTGEEVIPRDQISLRD